MLQGQLPASHWHPTAVQSPAISTAHHSLAPASPDVQYANGSDVTLQRIHAAANEDIEMQDAFPQKSWFLVLDTNILIHHLEVIQWFCKDVEALQLPLLIIIPSVLISELDGLKKRQQVGWFARRASTWVLEKMRERKTVKVQARWETATHLPALVNDPLRKNDNAICDCCLYFMDKGHVVLLTGDVNMTNDSLPNGVETVMPSGRGWSSRELAHSLFGDHIDGKLFHGSDRLPLYRPVNKADEQRTTEVPGPAEDNLMDVDEGGSTNEYIPSHAWDALHLQVIDHFTLVLKDLANRIRTAEGDVGPPTQSSHAPGYRRKDFQVWTVGDCLDYLGSKKSLRASSPSLQVFLLRRNEDRGWRRGQDWSRRDWENAMAALQDLGTKFGDWLVLASVHDLALETARVFNTPMRPTGL